MTQERDRGYVQHKVFVSAGPLPISKKTNVSTETIPGCEISPPFFCLRVHTMRQFNELSKGNFVKHNRLDARIRLRLRSVVPLSSCDRPTASCRHARARPDPAFDFLNFMVCVLVGLLNGYAKKKNFLTTPCAFTFVFAAGAKANDVNKIAARRTASPPPPRRLRALSPVHRARRVLRVLWRERF